MDPRGMYLLCNGELKFIKFLLRYKYVKNVSEV